MADKDRKEQVRTEKGSKGQKTAAQDRKRQGRTGKSKNSRKWQLRTENAGKRSKGQQRAGTGKERAWKYRKEQETTERGSKGQ